jgi:hypothetical protein
MMRVFSRLMRHARLIPLLLAAGCIVVQDFGAYWAKGQKDPCLNMIALRHFVDEDGLEPEAEAEVARSLRIGEARFMMVRDAYASNPNGGSLYRYVLAGGTLITYRLNEAKRDVFERDFPGHGLVITGETVTIPALNESTLMLLARLEREPDYWVEAERFAYNPARNPACQTAEPQP